MVNDQLCLDLPELEIVVTRDKNPSRGPVRLTNQNSLLDTTWETVIGHDKNYTGTVLHH